MLTANYKTWSDSLGQEFKHTSLFRNETHMKNYLLTMFPKRHQVLKTRELWTWKRKNQQMPKLELILG